MQHLCHIEQRLGRHAAAQDTQPAQLLGAVDHGSLQPQPCRDPRGIKPRATPADRDEVVDFQISPRFLDQPVGQLAKSKT